MLKIWPHDRRLPPIYGTSQVCDINPYQQNKQSITIYGNMEIIKSKTNLDLYYRYSNDNTSWSEWTFYETDIDSSDGWSWEFNNPKGPGYYQFYSLSHTQFEQGWFNETAPIGPDAILYII